MQVGTQSEEVVVTTEAPALQTDTASVGQTLETQAVQDLPTEGRNLYSLVQLAPGASNGPADGVSSGQRPDDRRQASEVSANGQSDSRNNNLLDGMDNNSREGNIIIVRPSIDAIQELSVLTNDYPAEAGNVAGAVVNMLTKSGTNDFHGTAYEYFRNDLFDGRNYFSTGFAKPELRQNQFGGSVGGPIRKDKTFFFVDAEDLRQIKQTVTEATVPTLQEENNLDFTDNGGTNLSYYPSYFLDPAGLALFKLYPKPTNSNLTNNYTATPKGWQYSLTTDARVDHHFNANNLLFARYSYNKADTLTPGLFPSVNGIQPGGNIFGFEGTAHETAQNTMLDYTHIFTPNLILELKQSYTRFVNTYVTLNEGNNASKTLGVANVNDGPTTTGLTDAWPIGAYASLGDSTYEPGTAVYNDFQEAGILSYTHGAHSIKAGASLMRRQMNLNAEGSYPLGVFYFVNLSPYGLGLSPNVMEELITGVGYASRQNDLVPTYPRFWETGLFVQDDWRMTPKITVNLGVRYDVFTPETDAKDHLANLNLATSSLILSSNSKTVGVSTDYHDVVPRIGFSASLTKNTVVHGGFALSYFPADTQNTLLGGNPPFVSSWVPPTSLATLSASNIYQAYFGNLAIPSSPGTNLSTFSGSLETKPANYPSSYMEEFNVNVQHQIGQNVITVGYVGELGRKINLAGGFNIDLPAPNPDSLSPSAAPYAATLPDVSVIDQLLPEGSSSYHSLQAAFARHFAHGWSMNANYTWSHTIDDIAGSSYVVEPYGLLPRNFNTYDRGNGDLDLRNRVAVSGSYSFPFTSSFTGVKKTVLNGWQLNGIGFWQSGSEYTIEDSSPRINIGGAALVTADRPNVYSNYTAAEAGITTTNTAQVKALGATNASYEALTTANIICLGPNNTGKCFAPQQWGTAGSVGKNTVFGPSLKRVDLSLFRDFKLTDWMKFQFRAETYDLTNTPSLANPGADIGTPSAFGVISSTLPGTDQRVFQFALKLIY